MYCKIVINITYAYLHHKHKKTAFSVVMQTKKSYFSLILQCQWNIPPVIAVSPNVLMKYPPWDVVATSHFGFM